MEPKDKALGLVPRGSLPRDIDPDVKKLICRGTRVSTENFRSKVLFAKWFMNVEIPLSEEFLGVDTIYAKLESPFVLYDKTGWLQVPYD